MQVQRYPDQQMQARIEKGQQPDCAAVPDQIHPGPAPQRRDQKPGKKQLQGISAKLVFQRLDRVNATTPDPMNPLLTINVGETRTEGVELALTGRVRSNWQVSGGYSWLDARLQGNEAVRLAQTPKQQFSLWNRYDLSRRLGLGLGVIHQSSQFAAIRTSATTTRLPAFTRLDAAVFFRVSDTVQLQLNIENLLDTAYFSDAHNNFNISTGAPLNARLTLTSRF